MVAFALPVDDTNGRRAHPRAPLSNAAYLSEHRVLIARVGDLSANGAFLATQYPDPVGTRGTLAIEIDGERVQLAIEVVRVGFFGRTAGMGVCFVDVPRAIKRRLLDA